MGVVLVFCFLNGIAFSPYALLAIPLLIELYIFSLAIAFFLAAINVKYRDIGYLWEIFLQAAFYATPVIYPLQMVVKQMPQAANWLMMNPVAQIIQDIRYWLVTKQTITLQQLVIDWRVYIPFIIIGTTLVLAVHYFRKNQKYFAEYI